MADPEIQIIHTEINTDHANYDSESVMVYPDLFQFMKQTPWRVMNTLTVPHVRYLHNLRHQLQSDADFVFCKVDTTKNIVKLILMESESHILMLKVSNLEEKIKNKISAENLERTLGRKVFCMTPGFELVEPTQMVEGVPRRGFMTVPLGCPLPQGLSVLRGQSVPRSFPAQRFHPNKFQPQVRPAPRSRPVPRSHPNKYQLDDINQTGNFSR